MEEWWNVLGNNPPQSVLNVNEPFYLSALTSNYPVNILSKRKCEIGNKQLTQTQIILIN